MKVLHIGDASGVTMVLAKWQARIPGVDVTVTVQRQDDPYEIMPYYMGRRGAWHQMSVRATLDHRIPGDRNVGLRRKLSSLMYRIDNLYPLFRDGRSLDIARVRTYLDLATRQAMGCDVVHVHGAYDWLKHLRAALPRSTFLVIHHHGDQLRSAPRSDMRAAEACADLALVSTPDLLAYGEHRTHLPNPVDTETFAPRRPRRPSNPPRAFYLVKPWEKDGLDSEKANLINRWCPYGATAVSTSVMYRDMPAFLRNYDVFCNIKRTMSGTLDSFLDMTGLQSLAVGLDVIVADGTTYRSVPAQHMPEAVAAQTLRLYHA